MSNRYLLAALCLSLMMGNTASAQSLGKVLKDAAKRSATRETSRQVEKKVAKVVRCVFGDEECIARARRDGNEVEVVASDAGAGGSSSSSGGASSTGSGSGAWVNYDFVPGSRILFAEDFRSERVGNFPRSLRFVSGNMEIAEMGGERYIRSTSASSFIVPLPEDLPERFTIELDYRGRLSRGLEILTEEFTRNTHYYPNSYLLVDDSKAGLNAGKSGSIRNRPPESMVIRNWQPDEVVPVRVMGDGDYIKVFVGENRITNVPNAKLPRGRSLQINLRGNERAPALLGNLRIAAGETSIYDALLESGRVATQGILFDTGRDVIRPESTPTLTEIGEMLQQYGDLRLRIEGHTDNVGSSASNRALSERRAAAVRDHLIRNFGIAGSRLEAQGFGDTRPAATNETGAGRQQNRRVELVRL